MPLESRCQHVHLALPRHSTHDELEGRRQAPWRRLLRTRHALGEYSGDNELARLMDEADDAEEKWAASVRMLDQWRSAPWPDVLRVFRRVRRAA